MKTLRQVVTILITTVFFCAPPTTGMGMFNIDTKGAGNAAVEILRPIIEPIAQEIVAEAAAKLRGALDILSHQGLCKLNCVTFQAVNCRPILVKQLGKLKVGACKDQCQKIIKVGGGYTLKIRYTEPTNNNEGWSLQNCVQTAQRAGVHEFQEYNRQSIAIYGKQDYDLAMEIIGDIAALDRFILKNFNVHWTEGKTPNEINSLVEKAKKEVAALNTGFQQYAQKNFGPQ